MSHYIFLLMLSLVYTPAWSDSLPTPLPDTIYFSVDWCPREKDLTELRRHLNLTMNGCCISKAEVLTETKNHPKVLAPWEYRTSVNGYPTARCDGKVLTDQEEEDAKIAYEKWSKERHEKEKIEIAARLSSAPAKLKAMSKEEFCITYGNALREGIIDEVGTLPNIIKLVKNEANRRQLRFDDFLVREQKIRMGISECQLYASWGLSEDQNRSVGRWGVHTQHIYGNRTYVYTENGKVTSWQN